MGMGDTIMNKALYFSLAASLLLAGSATLLPGSTAFAQSADPDIRDIRPIVMLLVDTSGSMERMSGGFDASLPACAGSIAGVNQRNRWAQVMEGMTGSWNDTDYFCTSISRSTLSTASPDYAYYLPYHTYADPTLQNNDGVLDVYLERIKFGLMTFDSTYTFTDAHQLLVPRTTFMSRLADNATIRGGFSYGNPQPLSFPGCATTFMVDSGVRNESAPAGTLIPVSIDDTDLNATNAAIQAALFNVRPYGGTPTAALLDDLRYYFNNHPTVTGDDPFSDCRPRFAVLLTDGQPDEDFRDVRFNCDATGGCPYDLATAISADLCRYSSSTAACEGLIDGLFVVAFDVSDPAAIAELDAIAAVGGTSNALLATDRATLMRRMTEILDRAAPGNTTRSTPAFISGGSTTSASGPPTQLEFNAGFRVGGTDTPWTGILERTRFVCDVSLVPEAEPVSSRVEFGDVLNRRTAPRRLLTVVTPSAADMDGNIIGPDSGSVPLGAVSPAGAVVGPGLVAFDATIEHDYFGIAGGSPGDRDARRTYIVDWVNGTTTDRVDNRLGDIYHSSPVAISTPRIDIADESYNLFRRRPEVANRPTVVYVGTNDGILHAFVAEDHTDLITGRSYTAGEELWGFIPPILVQKLESATTSHQIMVDGTPLVRDVFYRRQAGDTPNGDIYHTVLVMGFRAGAPGYFALDVTDPVNPEFLWQYVGEQPSGGGGRGGARSITPLGYSYGTPAIGQVLVDIGGTLQERAIVLLPGGSGDIDEDARRTTGPVGCPARGIGEPPVTDGTTMARSRQRCWSNTGRIITWVDLVTGEVIRTFDHRTFNAPLTGGVALAPGDIGTIAERAFLTDADGVMWAIDFSARRPSDWTVRPFHDIFWDDVALSGQPAYAPPIISSDSEGRFVVIQSTGDIDRLDSTAANRVVSLTEEVSFGAGGAASYTTSMNWEIRLRVGEQVTGALELFEGTVYFASFESALDPSNMCALGQSRIWGIDYLNAGASPPSGYSDPTGAFPEPRFESTPGLGVFDDHFRGPFVDQLVLGVGITQRPTCLSGADEFDPYIGTRYRVGDVGRGTFMLRAQVSGGSASPTSGAIPTLEEQLPTPQSYTIVQGFAGQVDN